MADSSMIISKNISQFLPYISIFIMKITFSFLNEFYRYIKNIKTYFMADNRAQNSEQYDQNLLSKYNKYSKEIDVLLEKFARESSLIDPHELWLFFVKINMFGFEIYQDVFSSLKVFRFQIGYGF